MKQHHSAITSLLAAAPFIVACGAAGESTSDYVSLREKGEARQAGYPAPPPPDDRSQWVSSSPPEGAPLNGPGASPGGGGSGGTSTGTGGGAGAGGAPTGGIFPTGNVVTGGIFPTGNVATGGVATGMFPTGGITTGNVVTGGIVSGGVLTGIFATGNVLTGNVVTGNVVTGGIVSGGVLTGIFPTGNIPTGGIVTGGIVTGGVVTGGVVTGGTVTPSAVDQAVNSNVSFYYPSTWGYASPSVVDPSISVTLDDTPPLLLQPDYYSYLYLTYSSSNYPVTSLSVAFGAGTPNGVGDFYAYSGYPYVELYTGPSVCTPLSPGCFPFDTDVTAYDAAGYQSPTLVVPTVLVCGGCADPGCAQLDPGCAGTATTLTCGATVQPSASVPSQYLVNVGATSGALTVMGGAFSTGSARIQVFEGPYSLLDTGCVAGAGAPIPGQYNVKFGTTNTGMVSVVVTPNCGATGTSTVLLGVSCAQ